MTFDNIFRTICELEIFKSSTTNQYQNQQEACKVSVQLNHRERYKQYPLSQLSTQMPTGIDDAELNQNSNSL